MLHFAGLSDALLAQYVEEAQVGSVKWYKRDVENERDAASLIYEFVKNRAQEEAVVLILDAQNRPISILRHQMGSDGSTNFAANIIAGTVAATPGAKKVYVAHNHPGRGVTYSDQDIGTHYTIGQLLANVGVEFKGAMILADANYDMGGKGSPKFLFTAGGKDMLQDLNRYADGRPDGNDPQAQEIPLAADMVPKRNGTDDREGFDPSLEDEQNIDDFARRSKAGLFDVPIVERVFAVRGRALAKVRIGAENGYSEVAPLLQNKPGLAFMDASLGLMAVLPLSIRDMGMLISYVSRSRRMRPQGAPKQLGAASLRIAPINDANGKTNGGYGIGRDKPAYQSSPLARILAVYAKTNSKRIIIHLGEIDVDRIRSDYIAGNREVIDEDSGWDGASNGDIIDAVENLKTAIKQSGLELLEVTNNYQGFGPTPFELGTPVADDTKAPIDTVFPDTDEGQEALKQDQTPGAVRNLKKPLRPDGTRAPFREEGDAYGAEGGVEGIVREGLQGDKSLESISKIIPPNAVGEDGGIYVDLVEWWANTTEEEKAMLREIINDKEKMESYEANVRDRERAFLDGSLPANMAQDYTAQEFTLHLRNWLKTGGDKMGLNETNPDDPNAQADFDRQEREAGARVNKDMPSSLDGATDVAPLLGTYKPKNKLRLKSVPGEMGMRTSVEPEQTAPMEKIGPSQGVSKAGPSIFPRTLSPATKFGRWTGEQLKDFGLSQAMLDQFVEHATVGHIMSGVEFVKNAGDAAHVVSYLRKKPVEEIVILVTDKDGKPLHVTKHSTAHEAAACVFNLPILIGSAASTPGAATLWFIHNHPSRKPFLSNSDENADRKVRDLTEAAGLKFGATIAIAGNVFAARTSPGQSHAEVPIKPMARKFKVPLTERQFAFHVGFKGKKIDGTEDSSTLGAEVFGTQPGVIFLDNNERPVATLPLSLETLVQMRKPDPSGQTGYGKFVATTERAGGLHMILYLGNVSKNDEGAWMKAANNFSRMVKSGSHSTNLKHITNLDGDDLDPSSPYGDFEETGDDYNASQDKPSSLREAVEQAAKKKSELDAGEGDPEPATLAQMGELERSWRESMAAKKEAEANATFSAEGVRVNHNNQELADQGFITHRAAQDMAGIMASIRARFPDGYRFYSGNGQMELKPVSHLQLQYTSADARAAGYGFEHQDYVLINIHFEDGTKRLVASLDLMRGYGSTPGFPTTVTKVGMSQVNSELMKLGLGSILYVEGGERLRRMGQTKLTGSIINAAAAATRVRAFPAGTTELIELPGSINMNQKQMAAAALSIIRSGKAAYTSTRLDQDVALEPEANYDDGENMRIPGGARDEHLKAREKLEKLAAEAENDGYMKIGHGYLGAEDRATQHNMPGEAIRTRMNASWKKDARMWIMPEGRVVFSDTIDRLEVRKLNEWKRSLKFAEDEVLKQPTDQALIHQVTFIKGMIKMATAELTSSTSAITHSSGFFKDQGFNRSTPQGRVEVTKHGVLVSVTRLGNNKSESEYRVAKEELIASVAKELKVSPDTIRVVDIDGYTGNGDSDDFDRVSRTPEDDSAREPAANYDDGENTVIPGGGRQAWLKKQAELRAKNELPGARRIQWWTDIGHKGGKKNREKTWLWAYDRQGKLQVINADELRTKMIDDGYLGATPTHLDWEEAYFPGLLSGTAHGRIDATEPVIRISMTARIEDPTFREQVKQDLAEYIGADVDKVKGYDFTGDGMPELFNRTQPGSRDEIRQLARDLKGMDLDEAKAYFKKNPDKVKLMSMSGLPPHLERIIKAMREGGYIQAKAYVEAHPLGKLLMANGRLVIVRDASEIPGMTPLDAARGGFNAVVMGNNREATYFVGEGISEAEIDALIKHEIGVHMGIGKDTDLVNDLFADLYRLMENGASNDVDRIMAGEAVIDAFKVVAGHFGQRQDPKHREQQGDVILRKIYEGDDETKDRYADARIRKILKEAGLDAGQIDNFMRVFHEETLGYLMNIMAERDSRVNAPQDGLFAIIVRWIKATMIRMAYANSQGGNRLVAGATMGALRGSSRVARAVGLNQLSKVLAITPGDVRAIAQGYVQAYADGKEVSMPETRDSTEEDSAQHDAREAQLARVAGRTGDPVTNAGTAALFNRTMSKDTRENGSRGGSKQGLVFQASTEEQIQAEIDRMNNENKASGSTDVITRSDFVGLENEQVGNEQPLPTAPIGPLGTQLPVGPNQRDALAPVKGVSLPSVNLDLPVAHKNKGQVADTRREKITGARIVLREGIHKPKKKGDGWEGGGGFGLVHIIAKHGSELRATGLFDGLTDAQMVQKAVDMILSSNNKVTKVGMSQMDPDRAAKEPGKGTQNLSTREANAILIKDNNTGLIVALRIHQNDPSFAGYDPESGTNFVTVASVYPQDANKTFETIKGGERLVSENVISVNQGSNKVQEGTQVEETGEQLQAKEGKIIEGLSEAQGNGPADINFLNAIPPTPPPPTPTAPTSPAPAPLNPPVTNDDVARRVTDALRGRYFDGISTKAHQNAERTGSAAVRAVADIIHTRGGREDTSTQRDLPKAIMTARAKYQNKFNDIMAPLREQLGNMTSEQREQFYRDLVDQITGRTNIQPGTSGHAATGLINLLKELHDYRTAAGEELGEVQQYFPAVYNSALITANKAAFIADATRAYEIELSQDPNLTPQEIQAKAAAAAEALYRTHTRSMGDAEWASIFKGPQDSATENSSKERVFGRQAQGIMSKWQSPDPFHVISRYIGSSAKRAELVRRFGPDGEKWEAMANAMEAEGASIEVINEMAQLVKLSAGLGVTPLGTGERMFMDAVNLYTAAGALGKSAMNNLYEPGAMGNRAATVGNPIRIVQAYAETWARFIRNLVQMLPVLGEHVGPTFWQEYGEHIGSIHNSLDDAWMSMHAMEHGMEDASPRMRWLTNRVYMANLMESTENAKLQASHSLGHAYIMDHAGLLDGSHYIPRLLKMDTTSVAEEALLELGIPKSKQAAFAAWCANLKATKGRAQRMAMLTDGSEMSLLYEEAQLRFSHQSAVRANRSHKPIFQDGVLGGMALQLMSFSYSYYSEVTSRMYTMARRAITTKDMPAIQRISMMLPVMLSPLTVVAMAALFESKDYLFPTESSEKRKKEHWIYKLLNAASFAGMFNPKIEMATKFIARDQPPGGLAGQTIVAAARVGKKAIELGMDDTKTPAQKEAILKNAAGRAAVTPIKAGAVTLGSAAHPAIGAAAVIATNTTGWSNELQNAEAPKMGSNPPSRELPGKKR